MTLIQKKHTYTNEKWRDGFYFEGIHQKDMEFDYDKLKDHHFLKKYGFLQKVTEITNDKIEVYHNMKDDEFMVFINAYAYLRRPVYVPSYMDFMKFMKEYGAWFNTIQMQYNMEVIIKQLDELYKTISYSGVTFN